MSTVFFTDRDLGRELPGAVLAAGMVVESHADHFAHDTPDSDWIPIVSQRGWVILTRDRRMRYKPAEREAILRSGARVLILVGKVTHRELAINCVRSRARIESFIARNTAPFIARIYRPSPAEVKRDAEAPGRVERWLP